MPAGELGTIATTLYVEALHKGATNEVRATATYVNVLARVIPAAMGTTSVYVDVMTEAPPWRVTGHTGWGMAI